MFLYISHITLLLNIDKFYVAYLTFYKLKQDALKCKVLTIIAANKLYSL